MAEKPFVLLLMSGAMKPLRRLRRHTQRRCRILWAAAISTTILGGQLIASPTPLFVWNASRSAPLGLYWVGKSEIARGDFVFAILPPGARALAATRGYLPANVPLVKRVAAMSDDVVCSVQSVITINGRIAAMRLSEDARGRPLPFWEGCYPLPSGEYFLLMEGVPDSFDGRYFGPIHRTQIIGKLVPIWTW